MGHPQLQYESYASHEAGEVTLRKMYEAAAQAIVGLFGKPEGTLEGV